MKKLLLLIMLISVFAFTACGAEPADDKQELTAPPTVEADAATEPTQAGLSYFVFMTVSTYDMDTPVEKLIEPFLLGDENLQR